MNEDSLPPTEELSLLSRRVLPLRDTVVFPHTLLPLMVGRDASLSAITHALNSNEPLVVLTQEDSTLEEPLLQDFYPIGTEVSLAQVITLPDGTMKVLVEGIRRVRVRALTFLKDKPLYMGKFELVSEDSSSPAEVQTLFRIAQKELESFVRLTRRLPNDTYTALSQIENPDRFADTAGSALPLRTSEKSALLVLNTTAERLEFLITFLGREQENLDLEQKIKTRLRRQVEANQREYYLHEQIKAIQKELGEEDFYSENEALAKRIQEAHLPKSVREKAENELKRLKSIPPTVAESGVLRTYLEWILDLPWHQKSDLRTDFLEAEQILTQSHFGLEKPKERILEQIAVQMRKGQVSSQILCLYGPPGVGKTSLARAMAEATGREFVRISLGGVRDEAEIRGHRRTYVGAMPGRIISAMKRAGTSNPLILLDEIDKMSQDWRGDPASALLEVLDPEQNKAFNDHYLEVDYDLSSVMFVATANTLNLPRPLIDRLELLPLSGYTFQEKKAIAEEHLWPRVLEDIGLKKGEIRLGHGLLDAILEGYTREAGVRQLERKLRKIARKALREVLEGEKKKISISRQNVSSYLGPQQYVNRPVADQPSIGLITGLAWTEAGGEILEIEAVKMPGKGNVSATGKLGEVMRESVQTATTFVRSRFEKLKIDAASFEKWDIHVHVPEGAVPKDGPSAGIAIATVLASVLTGKPIRNNLAMTGEITLRGKVLGIGGVKEKLLAALRYNIPYVILPADNEKDWSDLPEEIKAGIEARFVESADEVLDYALGSHLSRKKLIPFGKRRKESEAKAKQQDKET